MRKYYEAYDERYKTVHEKGMRWASDEISPIVFDTMLKYGIGKNAAILETGCGEGRDAIPLLQEGYDLLAVDISEEAVNFCRSLLPKYKEHFVVLDCINEKLDRKFDFIYSVAVVHMLISNKDRAAFYRFIYGHLADNGIALIMSMGDGQTEHQSDPDGAFEPVNREHNGKTVTVAATSLRTVSNETFEKELLQSGFQIIERGQTSIPREFSHMMYAVVKKAEVV